MRRVTIIGKNDGLSADLSRDVGLIVEIMQMKESIAVDEITFKLILTGDKVIEFINKHNLDKALIDKIVVENNYEITAYDW